MVIWKNQQENGMHLLQNRGRKGDLSIQLAKDAQMSFKNQR